MKSCHPAHEARKLVLRQEKAALIPVVLGAPAAIIFLTPNL